MDLTLIIPVALVLFAGLLFLIIHNRKDRKQFEEQLKNDYRKPRDDEGDISIGEND